MSRSAALALALVLLAGVAVGQPSDVAKADALFREGRALMKKGDYETACPKLEESYRLDPAAGTGINLGDCFEKRGKVASALLAYQAAWALLQPGDPRIGPVEKEISALDKRAPRLTIKLAAGAPPGTHVRRDGRKLAASQLGVGVPINPGRHVVLVGAPDHEERRLGFSLAEGDVRELVVAPGEPAVNLDGSNVQRPTRWEIPPDAQQPEGSSRSTLGYVIGGVGVAGLVGAGVVEATLVGRCPDRKCKNQSDLDLVTPARIFWGIGAVGVAVGGYLLLTDDADVSAPQTAIGPSVVPGGAAMTVRGAF